MYVCMCVCVCVCVYIYVCVCVCVCVCVYTYTHIYTELYFSPLFGIVVKLKYMNFKYRNKTLSGSCLELRKFKVTE